MQRREKMQKVTIRIPRAVAEDLEWYRAWRKVKKSDIVRTAIREMLKKYSQLGLKPIETSLTKKILSVSMSTHDLYST